MHFLFKLKLLPHIRNLIILLMQVRAARPSSPAVSLQCSAHDALAHPSESARILARGAAGRGTPFLVLAEALGSSRKERRAGACVVEVFHAGPARYYRPRTFRILWIFLMNALVTEHTSELQAAQPNSSAPLARSNTSTQQ